MYHFLLGELGNQLTNNQKPLKLDELLSTMKEKRMTLTLRCVLAFPQEWEHFKNKSGVVDKDSMDNKEPGQVYTMEERTVFSINGAG